MLFASFAVFLLLCLSAFFSGSETALTGASKAYMQDKEKNEKSHRAKMINKLFEKKDNLIITTLLGSNLANTLATSLSTSVLIGLFGNEGVAYATVIMTVLVLIYTDMLPKTYAVRNANKMALIVGPFIRIFVTLFSPLVYILQIIVKFTFKIFGLKNTDNDEQMAIAEIRGAINMYNGTERKEQKEMLKGILDLSEIQVYDVMNHRKNLFALDIDLPTEEKIKKLQKCPYSRVPLYREKPDNIVGVLIVKNFLKECVRKSDDLSKIDFSLTMIKPWFIPDNTSLFQQLKAFRDKREHFAIVIDEYGVIEGIVTLEDIIEEIVGDINDESDLVFSNNSSIKKQGNSFIVEGETTIRDLNRQNGWELDDDNVVTIAGYLIDKSRTIPQEGQSFVFDNFKFEVTKRHKNQITQIKITKLKNN